MKKTPQNVNNINNDVNPHYLHQIARVSSNNIPRQASNVSQKYATTPRVMHEYDKMMMMMMTMHGGLYLNNQQHALDLALAPYHHHTNSFPPTMTPGHGPHQPPLLPFPPAISRPPPFHSQPPLRRSQSLSPPVIVPRKAPAKLNKTPMPPKKENKNGAVNNSVELSSGKVGKSSKARKRTQVSLGPNPDVTRMLSDVEIMDGCAISPVFRMAPPPSSLPLPRFTLRSKPPPPMKLMRCKAEAGAVDGAATDNICMLLKLR